MSDADLVRGDLEWGTIPALLRSAAATHGDHEALVDATAAGGTERLSYQELSDRAHDTARALVAAGVQPGDRVAIWAPNIWEWPVTALGVHLAGAVLVPINTRYKGTEAAFILSRSGAVALFCVEGFLDTHYVSMLSDADLPALRHTVVMRGDVPAGAVGCDSFLAGAATVEPGEIDARVEALGPDDLSDILFTSGTTGAPKGVMATHGQTVRAFCDWASVVGLRSDDRYLIVNPFFHAFGYKAGLVASLTKGATMVTEAVFDVAAVKASIARESISMIPGPPTLYQTILNDPDLDPAALGSLRLAVTGAAVVPVELIRRMHDDLGFETVITGYGLTEACGIATMCRHDDPPEVISATSGRAIPGVTVTVVDPSGEEVPRGTEGEILVAGYNVMKGYFEDPEQTAEAIDADGRLHTGDIGVMDDAGYVAITDRLKDMFIVGGFNAYPAEIESLLCGHPSVAQAAVVGVPDERMGEVGYAFVVARAGTEVDPDEITAWARENMANFKVPRVIEAIDALPLNASGKVLRYELRDLAATRRGDSA